MGARTAQSFAAAKNSRVALVFNRSGNRAPLFSAAECDAVIRWAEDGRSGWTKTRRRRASDWPWEKRLRDRHRSSSARSIPAAGNSAIDRLPGKLRDIGYDLNRQIWRFDLTGWSDVFLVRYEIGDALPQHSDLSTAGCAFKLTVLLQLSPPAAYEGGMLEFGAPPSLAARAQGSVLVFPAWLPHCVAPIAAGTRYVATCFALGPSFR